MQIPVLVHISSAPKDLTSSAQLNRVSKWVCKAPKFAWLYFLSFSMASVGMGVVANSAIAQSRCSNSWDCGVSTRPVAYPGEGVVSTNSGIGLNIRSGPGLNFAIIGGADDGAFLNMEGRSVVADGYRWRQVASGGWVATEYVMGSFQNTGLNGCGTTGNVSYYNGGCGGSSQPVSFPNSNNPIYRPISSGSGPYVVAVPGTNRATLTQVRQIVPNAYFDQARQGVFINAGGYSDFNGAKSLSYLLRNNGLDARVIYK